MDGDIGDPGVANNPPCIGVEAARWCGDLWGVLKDERRASWVASTSSSPSEDV